MLRELAPELATAAPGELRAARLPDLRLVITIGEETVPGTVRFDDVYGLAGNGRARTDSPRSPSELQFDDPINIQFTSGTTGFPKGATLSHHNILNNGLFIAEAMKLTRARPGVHSGAALSLLRHGDRQSRLPDARRGDGLSERRLRSARHPRGDRGRALHRSLRRADDVHRRDGPPRFREIRSVLAAHRHDGRQPLPDRGHEAGLHRRCTCPRSSSATA